MRLMDHHDNPQSNNKKNCVKQDHINHSSPVPTPSPTIAVNSTLRVTTMFLDHRTGKVVAFDPEANLVTLHLRGSKVNLTSVAMINLNNCREWIVEEEGRDDPIDCLYPIDIIKLKKRQLDNEMEKKKEASFVNLKASRVGRALFRDIKKTMNEVIRWSNNDIVINNTVRIVDPYHTQNVSIDPISCESSHSIGNVKTSAKSDNDTKTHIRKLVERFWSDESKMDLCVDEPNSSSRTKCDNLTRDAIDSMSTV